MKYLLAILPLLCLLSMVGCEPKDEVITTDPDAVLRFSADTVLFDTVFVTQGSVTRRLKVYNTNQKAVRISSINLAGANASPYKLIINGVESPVVNDLELRGQDSLYILVSVNVNPADQNLPFLVADSILFHTNGSQQNVKLVAYGQDAVFHRKSVLGTTKWAAGKPHVLLDTVLVREGATLTIEKGAQVFASNKAVLLVNGTLRVEGTPEERVRFSGLRREPAYVNAPGQWEGIRILTRSENNVIRYADIRNTMYGLRIGNPGKGGTLLEGCAIQYAFLDGIVAFTSDVKVVNTLIHNCGQYGFGGLGGGNYEVLYSTIVNYSNQLQRETPAFVITDYIPGTEIKNQPTQLRLVNSIVYSDGSSYKNEVLLDGSIQAEIAHNILRTEAYKNTLDVNSNLLNVDPKFKEVRKQNFSLDTLSPASGAATPLQGINKDLRGINRSTTKPDIGAFERTID
ncbi:choice-of-anchor Q domain-containing protein [uncultured Pontibacter sp.]|uniref:choice-of-anchor Q domain-containing protein n=1 Tax=uncultured Pontibacter sp. TaxID=453356 RepID=UPI0026056DE4|nr:choice-of-anchor Q domain-containing protein [uncultured Pontibacter sp.]